MHTTSIKQMARVAHAKGACFTDYPGAVCGNGVVENEEQCDSGGREDSCCTRQCKLAPTAVCSPMNDACCSDSCQIANTSEVCRPGGECVSKTFCDGLSTRCPKPQLYPSNTTCGSGNLSLNAYLCRAGVCSVETATPSKPPVTVCSLFVGATTCARGSCAPAGPDECKVCCNFDNSTDRCEPIEIYCLQNPRVIGCRTSAGLRKGHLPGGTPCSSTNGYCTVNATCKVVNVNPPTLLGVHSASDFFEYTWYFWVAGLGVVVVFSLIYLIISRLCPSERRMRRKAIEQKQRDVIAAHRQAKQEEKTARTSGTTRPSTNLDAIAGLATDPADRRGKAKMDLPRLPEATSVISLNEDSDTSMQPRVPPQGARTGNSTRPPQPQGGARPPQPQRDAKNTPPTQNKTQQNWGKQGSGKGNKHGNVKYV